MEISIILVTLYKFSVTWILYLKINTKISSTSLLLKESIVCNKVNYMLYKIIQDKESELCAIFSAIVWYEFQEYTRVWNN